MPRVTPEVVKKFLTEEILNGPLAEVAPAETLRLFLEQYVSGRFQDNFLPLEDLGRWNRLTKAEKLDACQKLYSQVKSDAISQVQLRATSGEFLALVYNENRVSILR